MLDHQLILCSQEELQLYSARTSVIDPYCPHVVDIHTTFWNNKCVSLQHCSTLQSCCSSLQISSIFLCGLWVHIIQETLIIPIISGYIINPCNHSAIFLLFRRIITSGLDNLNRSEKFKWHITMANVIVRNL